MFANKIKRMVNKIFIQFSTMLPNNRNANHHTHDSLLNRLYSSCMICTCSETKGSHKGGGQGDHAHLIFLLSKENFSGKTDSLLVKVCYNLLLCIFCSTKQLLPLRTTIANLKNASRKHFPVLWRTKKLKFPLKHILW